MAVFLKDFSTIRRELQNDVATALPQASQGRNSALSDIFVNPISSQFSFLYASIQEILDTTELGTLTGTDLDRYAENFGVTRKPGTVAQGTVFFVLDNSFDSGRDIEIPSGQTVTSTSEASTVAFRTTSSQLLRQEDREIYRAIAETNRTQFEQAGIQNAVYAVEVSIQAVATGLRGIVGTYSITGGSVNNVTDIINLAPTSGGFAAETDQALRQRVALVIAGNSVGTVAGVKSAALDVPGAVSAYVVTPGNVLMTRDGTIYDDDGNLIQEGTGNKIDVYIFGQRLVDINENYIFTEDLETENNISLTEQIILGTATSETQRLQPVSQVGSIIGSESGGNFSIATGVEDEEGNIVLEGHVAFIKDFEADNFSLVRNTVTQQLAIAVELNPNSSKYAQISSLSSSLNSNSILGLDRLIFLRKVASISREVVARGGELNGSDSLQFADVISIPAVEEDVKVERELVKIEQDGAFTFLTRHAPVVSISQVRHVRLGTNFNATIVNNETGEISLIGRFAPQSGDFLEVSYIWRKSYLSAFEYYSKEDGIGWVQPDFVIENDTLTIYSGTLETTAQPQYQPLTPTYLALNLSNAVKRAQYDISVVGDMADVYEDKQVFFQAGGGESVNDYNAWLFNTDLFAREDAYESHIGRVTKLRNVTRGFDYNLLGYKLLSNRYAPEAGINTELTRTQFTIDEQVNLVTLKLGDIVRFNAPESNANWASIEELTNNIKGNIQPVYDDTKIAIDEESAEVQLVEPEENENLAEDVADLQITEDTTWSGRIRVDGDLYVEKDAILTIEPGTVVQVISSSDLPSAQETIQQVKLTRTHNPQVSQTPPSDYEGLFYIFFSPNIPYFVVLSNDGTEELRISYNSDVISREKNNDGSYSYKQNGVEIEQKFIKSLETAIALNATLVSVRTKIVYSDRPAEFVYESYDVIRYGTEVYIVPLEGEPREVGTTVYDILMRDSQNASAVQTVEYEPTLGKYAVVPISTSTEIDWNLEYGVEVVSRAVITVRGTLVADAPRADIPIIFTSLATNKAPGDWGGIVFEAQSSTVIAGEQSILRNCVIKYAETGVQILNSDPIIESCLFKNYLATGGVSRNEARVLNKYTDETFFLTQNMFNLNTATRIRKLGTENIPKTFDVVSTATPSGYGECGYGYGYGYGYGECGYGYNGCQGTAGAPGSIVSGAYVAFTLPFKPITASQGGSGTNGIPDTYIVEGNRAVFDFVYGVDYTIYLGNEDITSKAIETFSNCKEAFLIAGVDFNIELNANTFEAELVFYNTRNMLAFLYQYASSGSRQFSITYAGIINNGEVRNCLFHEAQVPAWVAATGSDITLVNNTIYGSGATPVRIETSYVLLRNNIIAEYSTAPIVKDAQSIVFALNNNMYSSAVVAGEPYLPVDTDNLSEDMTSDQTILPVRNPAKYNSGLFLKANEEFMEINQVALQVRVNRGAFESTASTHELGDRLLLLRQKTFFTITGIPTTHAQLLLTDSHGQVLTTSPPITMIQIEVGTFRVAIPVDRENTVFYRYRFWEDNIANAELTSVRQLEVEQFGNAVNDLYSIAVRQTIATKNNYSADPKFINEQGQNFELETVSPSNINNPIYATPWDPSVTVNRFVGIVPREQEEFLAEGTKTITLDFTLLASGSLVESIVIQNATTGRRVLPVSFNPDTSEVTLVSPISLSNAGNYTIKYNSPISLGTSRQGNPIGGTIQYQFDAKRSVQFTKFKALVGGVGGIVRFAYRTSDRKDAIGSKTFSDFFTLNSEGEVNILTNQSTTNPALGSVIEFLIELQGNDGSFDSSGNYLYPKLQSFTLSYAPEIDEQDYEVQDIRSLSKSEETRVTLDPPGQVGAGILSTTTANLAGVDEIAVNVKLEETGEFLQIARIRSLNAGDKYVDFLGNFTAQRLAPAIGDIIEAQLSYVSRGSVEAVHFVNSSTQLTTNRFVGVTSIDSDIVLDRVSQTPGGEKLKVDITNQPLPGTGYNVSYDFVAPKDGETLTVSFAYNSLVGDVQTSVDANKDALADILARQMFGVDITIAANIVLTAGFSVNDVIARISQAVSTQFSTFVTESPQGGGRIDATDTLLVIKNVDGVDDLILTEHHRKGFVGVTNIGLEIREFPVLDATSPELTVVAATSVNTTLSTEG